MSFCRFALALHRLDQGQGPRSSAGGLRFEGLDGEFMLRGRAGAFAAGEMLDWEAPTGGYLVTAALATGLRAGLAAARRLGGGGFPLPRSSA